MRSAAFTPAPCTSTSKSLSPGTGSAWARHASSPSTMVTACTSDADAGLAVASQVTFLAPQAARLGGAAAQDGAEGGPGHHAGEDHPDERRPAGEDRKSTRLNS